jgi:hypothetical protein
VNNSTGSVVQQRLDRVEGTRKVARLIAIAAWATSGGGRGLPFTSLLNGTDSDDSPQRSGFSAETSGLRASKRESLLGPGHCSRAGVVALTVNNACASNIPVITLEPSKCLASKDQTIPRSGFVYG